MSLDITKIQSIELEGRLEALKRQLYTAKLIESSYLASCLTKYRKERKKTA